MPIYSAEAHELIKEFEAALLEQNEAMKRMAAQIGQRGAFADLAATLEVLELHNTRVMDLNDKLQPYRLDVE